VKAAHPTPEEAVMADSVQVVDYFYVMVPDKPGEGARVLGALRDAGVNLLAYTGFPEGRGAQLDFVPSEAGRFKEVAKAQKWKVKGPKKAFLVQGDDRIGVVAGVLDRLAAAKINVVAMDAVCAGMGRYGVLFWVEQRNVKKAAAALGATT
jgi:hypothetical protein